jgi:hypothetical protein
MRKCWFTVRKKVKFTLWQVNQWIARRRTTVLFSKARERLATVSRISASSSALICDHAQIFSIPWRFPATIKEIPSDVVKFISDQIEAVRFDIAEAGRFELLKLRVRNHIESKCRNDLVKEQRDLLARQKEELEAALVRVKQLEGIIPICSYCKKIKDEHDSWVQLEDYITKRSEALFSHGISFF